MYMLTALAAITSVASLFACRGGDRESDSCETRPVDLGTADQLSGNTLWHRAAVPGGTSAGSSHQLRSE